MMNWSMGKDSPQYKFAVVSKEQNNKITPLYYKIKCWLWFI